MIRGSVQQERVRILEHHPSEHTSHLFAAREHSRRLFRLVAREEHPSEEAADEVLFLILGVEPHPVDEVRVLLEKRRVVLRVVADDRGAAPADFALVGLLRAGEDVHQSR